MNQPRASSSAANPVCALPLPWNELLSHRGYMVRFAQRRLQDPTLAEDVVHDVFEAVLSGRAAFAGRSALRSWLTAILKHKIVDLVRQRVGAQGQRDSLSLDRPGRADEDDTSAEPVSLDPQPDEIAEQRELLAQVISRIEALPASLREAFTLRVLHDQPSATVCQTLNITENNLFQRLFRARQQLAAPSGALLH